MSIIFILGRCVLLGLSHWGSAYKCRCSSARDTDEAQDVPVWFLPCSQIKMDATPLDEVRTSDEQQRKRMAQLQPL